MNLEYNVFVEDFNGKTFVPYNVFGHTAFVKDIKKNFKKNADNEKEFEEDLRMSAQYYFWSKCEWEIIVSSWPPSDRIPEVKVDVYDQLRMNWHIFVEYVRSHKKEILKYKVS